MLLDLVIAFVCGAVCGASAGLVLANACRARTKASAPHAKACCPHCGVIFNKL